MFQRISITPRYPSGTSFDIGSIGEALIFYGEVILIVQYSSLEGIIKQFKPETLLRYLEHGRLKVKYRKHMIGALSQGENTPLARYNFAVIGSEAHNLEEAAHDLFIKVTGKTGRGRRFANRFLGFVEPISYQSDITSQIVDEVRNYPYISEYVARRFRKILPTGLKQEPIFQFGPLVMGQGFPLVTNIDFDYLNRLELTDAALKKPSSILFNYGATIADLSLWSQLGSEVAVNENQADILRSRFDILLNKWKQSEKMISSFQDICFSNGKALRQVINSGTRSLDDLYPVVERSNKFTNWLQEREPDANLIDSYYKEVTKDSWIDKLPTKVARWLVFTGMGTVIDFYAGTGIGTLAGCSISAFDALLLDKLLRGWKPNQFIHGELNKFINV